MNLKNITLTLVAIIASFLIAFSQSAEVPFKVEKNGKGKENIIFIPGFASSGDVWDETVEKLGDNYTSYILTMPGFAGVPAQSDPTFNDWRNQIINYIKEEKIENPILIGHSMGGVLAMDIAAIEPKLIAKIIVVDALPCLAALSDPNFKSNPNVDCSSMVKQFNTITEEQFTAMQKQTMGTLVTEPNDQKLLLDWSLQSDRPTFAKMFCDFTNVDLRESIKTINCPSLVLLNSQFTQIKPAIEQQYANLKNVDIEYAENSLHFIMLDAKDWYFEKIQNFLK